MKKLVFLLPLFFLSKLQAYDVIFNPYGGHNQYVSSLSSNTLKGYSNNVLVTSPTYSLNAMPPIIGTLQGTTTLQFTLDATSVTLQGQSVLSNSSATATYVNKIAESNVYNATSTAGFPFGYTVSNGSTVTFNAGTILVLNSSTTIKGSTTGNSAAPGYVGEYQESLVTSNTSVGTSGAYFDMTSLTLTSGDWDITGFAQIYVNGATFTSMDLELGIGTASGTGTTGLVQGVNYGFYVSGTVLGTSGDFTMNVPSYRVTIGGPTTYYLKGNVGAYTVGTPKYQCRLSARRMR